MTAFSFDNTYAYSQSSYSVESSTPQGLFLGRAFAINLAPAQALSMQKGQFLGRAFAIQPMAAQTIAAGSLTYRGVAY